MTDSHANQPSPRGSLPARAGIGLRALQHEALVRERPPIGWIEVHTENYFHDGGPHLRALERARELYPLSLHGVGLGLGSVDPPDREHLRRVRLAIQRFEPGLVSEHACWAHIGGEHFNDLLPLPYTEEAVEVLAARVREVQDALGRQILVENVSAYLAYSTSRLTEAQFLTAVVERSGCGLLLDVNNAYVTAENLGTDAEAFLEGLPTAAVQEIHLAGHRRNRVGAREVLIDDHGSSVCPAVWSLYARAVARFGTV
ncbi:MAG: MNIO family bufferin maturase, partial [Solimonas sp.]